MEGYLVGLILFVLVVIFFALSMQERDHSFNCSKLDFDNLLERVESSPDEIYTFTFDDNRNAISKNLMVMKAYKVQAFFDKKGYYTELSEERGYNNDGVVVFHELKVSKNPINK